MSATGGPGPGCSRRAVLVGACTAAAAAGCGGGSSDDSRPAAPVTGQVADIPLGGGTVFADRQVVVTRPAAGVLHAFSAVCTHQGCTVGRVEGDTILCPCHGSAFGASDGAVRRGPAERPLARREVAVDGAAFTVA